jgi:hypothetical protein
MKLLVLERFKHMKLESLPCCAGRLGAVVERECLRGCRGQVVGGQGFIWVVVGKRRGEDAR